MHVPGEALRLAAQGTEECVCRGRRPQKLALLCAPGPENLDLAHVTKRKAPAQRDERSRSARQLCHCVRAFGVARPGLLGHTGRKRRDRAELLPDEPARLIELVHPHVDEDAAAVRAEIRALWLAVPLEFCCRVYVADVSLCVAVTVVF